MARPHLHILIEPGSLAKYYSADCLAELEAVYEVSCEPAGGLTAEQVSERLVASGAAVAMTGWGAPGLTAGNYAAAPRLRLVAHFGGSVAMLSVTEGWQRGVTFINCAAGMVDAMAEATVGMMLAVGYQFPVTDRRLRGQGDFGHGYPLSYGLKGKRVGIFGLGHIGRRVAELLSAFKVERLGHDPFVAPALFEQLGVEPVASLEELLTRSEVLTIHAGWTTVTTGIIDAARLALLPDGALLVNNARLPIVDEEALLAEVRAGRLRAALNLVPARPELYGAQDLAGLGNLMFTSGAVNVSDVYAGGMSRMLTDDLVRYARGEPLQQVVTPAWVERTT